MKKIHYVHIFILLLFPLLLDAQDKKELKQIIEKQKEFTDITIPIEERLPQFSRALEAAGNWGSTFLGAPVNYKRIQTAAKRKVHVFVFDTAGKWNHEAITSVGPGAVFTGELLPGNDVQGHSTHVAGIVAGHNGTDVLGIAEALVDIGKITLYPYKVLTDAGFGSIAGIANGTNAANVVAQKLIAQGDAVIYNFSLGGGGTDASLNAALQAAQNLGVMTFIAAGNTGNTPVQFPGNSPYAKAVAALRQVGASVQRSTFSSYGSEIWIASPGEGIYSSYVPGNTYAGLSGTSMATPMTCGLAAVFAACKPLYTPVQILASIEKICTDISPTGRDQYTGFGYLLISKILDLPDNPGGVNPPPTTPCPTPQSYQLFTRSVGQTDVVVSSNYTPAVSYTYRYRQVGMTVYKQLAPSSNTDVQITGLTPNTTYELQLSVLCGSGYQSFFSVPVTFTTQRIPVDPNLPSLRTSSQDFSQDQYTIIWKTDGQTLSQKLVVKLPIVYTTSTLYAEQSYDYVKTEIQNFFTNSIIVLRPTDDFETATIWTAVFLKITLDAKLKDKGITVKVGQITGTTEQGRKANVLNPQQPQGDPASLREISPLERALLLNNQK